MAVFLALAILVAPGNSVKRCFLPGWVLWLGLIVVGEPSQAAIPTHTVEAALPRVLCLQARTQAGRHRFGAAVQLIPGRLLTVWHEIDGATSIDAFTQDELWSPARVIKYDAGMDLALLEVALQDGTIVLNPSPPVPGAPVFTVGCPKGAGQTPHEGVIRRFQRIDGRSLLQISMAIVEGDSGAPVFDAQGRMIGLIRGYGRERPRLGYAIPAGDLVRFLRQADFPLGQVVDFLELQRALDRGEPQAVSLLQELAQDRQPDPRPYRLLARFHRRLGDYSKALTYLFGAAERDPNDPQVFDALCRTYAALGWQAAERRACAYADSLQRKEGL